MSDSKERLLAYYKAMANNKTEQTDKILNKAVSSLSEEDADCMALDIEKRQRKQAKRVLAYAEKFEALNGNDNLQKYRYLPSFRASSMV